MSGPAHSAQFAVCAPPPQYNARNSCLRPPPPQWPAAAKRDAAHPLDTRLCQRQHTCLRAFKPAPCRSRRCKQYRHSACFPSGAAALGAQMPCPPRPSMALHATSPTHPGRKGPSCTALRSMTARYRLKSCSQRHEGGRRGPRALPSCCLLLPPRIARVRARTQHPSRHIMLFCVTAARRRCDGGYPRGDEGCDRRTRLAGRLPRRRHNVHHHQRQRRVRVWRGGAAWRLAGRRGGGTRQACDRDRGRPVCRLLVLARGLPAVLRPPTHGAQRKLMQGAVMLVGLPPK